VVMVAHQAERQYHRLKPLRGAGQHLQQPHPIIIIREDRLGWSRDTGRRGTRCVKGGTSWLLVMGLSA